MADNHDRAFIFDMDGTLVDNMRVHTEAWRTLMDENGLEFDERTFLIQTAGQTNREIIPSVFGQLSQEEIGRLARRKEEIYRESYLPHRKTIEGVVPFLTESKQIGVKMAVATAASNANMEFILDGLDLRRFFDAITTASDVAAGKPDPEMFLVSARKLGVEPENCLVFEDAFGGFEAARRAGMKAIGITTVNSAEDIMMTGSVAETHSDFTHLRPDVLIAKYLPY